VGRGNPALSSKRMLDKDLSAADRRSRLQVSRDILGCEQPRVEREVGDRREADLRLRADDDDC
jgi:hypothetical protein